jgi:hypothetical protein
LPTRMRNLLFAPLNSCISFQTSQISENIKTCRAVGICHKQSKQTKSSWPACCLENTKNSRQFLMKGRSAIFEKLEAQILHREFFLRPCTGNMKFKSSVFGREAALMCGQIQSFNVVPEPNRFLNVACVICPMIRT